VRVRQARADKDRIMRTRALRALVGAVALALAVPATGWAQDMAAQEAAAPAPDSAQLAALLAPVALYPDPLLTNILTASTYPLEVVDADRWLAEPGNAGLTDGALLTQLQQKDWDPSIKSLVPFPQILKMMDAQLDWTQQLGNAFLSQQARTMDAVQQLRRQAQAVGGLATTPQQIVSNDAAGAVEIQPADPQQVSVPSYQPAVYGEWPDPGVPPYAMVADDPGGYDAAYDNGWYFGPPVVLVSPIWFWGHCDWQHRRIDIDRTRFGEFNPHHPFSASTVWQHDPAHRRGVAYNDMGLRQRYQPERSAAPHPMPTVNGSAAEAPQFAHPLIESRPPAPLSRPPAPQQEPQRMPQMQPPQRAPQMPAVQGPVQQAPARAPVAPVARPPSRPMLPGGYRQPVAPQPRMMPSSFAAGPGGTSRAPAPAPAHGTAVGVAHR
jgi:Protein of unknown function (DUF3300)